MSQDFAEFITYANGNWDFNRMNKNLIFPGGGYSSEEEISGLNPPIIAARICAQTLGPNRQDNINQAVNSDSDRLATDALYQAKDDLGFDSTQSYRLFSWISYNIGHADPNCGNYFAWTALVYEGNSTIFIEIKDQMAKVLRHYNPDRLPIHPELQKLIDDYRPSTHYTAVRIPELKYNRSHNRLDILWPREGLSLTKGNPPTSISLHI